jgi:hypothetical protein
MQLNRIAALLVCSLSPLAAFGEQGKPGCTEPPSGLVGWWPGDGNANDIAGHENGKLTGGITFAPGMVCKAFLLNGINGFVNLGTSHTFNVSDGEFTVDAWVLFNTLSHPPGSNGARPAGDMSIVDKMAPTPIDNADGWRLLKQDNNSFMWCFGGGSTNGCQAAGGVPTTVLSTTKATTNTWYHVAGVKSSTEIAIYVNGVKEASQPLPVFTDSNSVGLLIGGNALHYAYFDGLIDEVELFNRALSDSEIQAIFSAFSAGKCKRSACDCQCCDGR